jgi:hypothetical protein
MVSYSALASLRNPGTFARTAAPLMQPSIADRQRTAGQRAHLLPTYPSSIPVEADSRVPQASKLELGSVDSPLESEADAMAAHVTTGGLAARSGTGPRPAASASHEVQPAGAPPIVHEALNSPGRELDWETRSSMEPRMGAGLGGVRIHTGGRAAEAAQSVQAQAYTVGQDIFFAAGKYNPHSTEGRRLLAHELSHTVQQSGRGSANGLSRAALSVQRDPVPQSTTTAAQGTTTDNDTKKNQTDQVTVPVPPSLLSGFQLSPPSLLAPPQTPSYFSPGTYSLGNTGAGSSTGAFGQAPSSGQPVPSLFTPSSQYTPSPLAPSATPGPNLSPTAQGGGSGTPATPPKAPERISLHDFGSLSVGARIGFPDLSKDTKPGDPPSALQESLKKGQILNFIFTGQPPSEYSIDPGKLVGALWGIFSTQIDPGLARKIAAGLASKPTRTGLTYQLDATILLNLGGSKPGGGGGATLTVNF